MIMKDLKHTVVTHPVEHKSFMREFIEGLKLAFIALVIVYSFAGFLLWQMT
jgi:hypothetical protein